jgi:hypothetical protein
MLLIIMLVLSLLATACFFIDSARTAWQNFVSLGLALFAGSVATYAVYLLEAEGKL